MSTRCQVQVIQEGLPWEQKITLYHHCDGYPSNIIPLLREAFNSGDEWERGRAGKAASFLCAVDPGQFEPEDSHQKHGDIEYYYKLYVVNTQLGRIEEKVQWEVEIYNPDNLILKRSPIEEIDANNIT
jgi:hypothetical protein